jgi:hypothetical protein
MMTPSPLLENVCADTERLSGRTFRVDPPPPPLGLRGYLLLEASNRGLGCSLRKAQWEAAGNSRLSDVPDAVVVEMVEVAKAARPLRRVSEGV